MAKPIKTGTGKWRVQVYLGTGSDGKRQYYKATVPTYKEAERLIALKRMERKVIRSKELTVEMGFKRLLGDVSSVLSPSTLVGYKQLARNAYKPINHLRIDMLEQADVQAWANWYAQHHSAKTVRNAYGLLCRLMTYHGCSPIKNISLPGKIRTQIKIPTDEHLAICLELCEHEGMRAAILLAAGAGLRRSEIAALEWKHVSFATSTIVVEQATVKADDGVLHVKSTKTAASVRTILVGNEIMVALQQLKQAGATRPIELTPDAITRRFERICAKGGFAYRFHDLRHYQASLMLAAGVPDKYAMERMGHASTSMLRSVYQHTISQAQRQFAATINTNVSTRVAAAMERIRATAKDEQKAKK